MKKIFNIIIITCLIIITMSILTIAIKINTIKNSYDINNDGIVDSKDVLLLQKYVLKNKFGVKD